MPGGRLKAQQVNLLLAVLVGAALLTGLTSWAVGDRWSGWFAVAHGVIGFLLLLLVPAKMRSSVRAGFRRGRWSRWVSAAFGVLVLATMILGVLHATGLWFGVGYWSALWTHSLFGFALIPLLVWHLVTRPVRLRVATLDRRAVLRTGLFVGGAAGVYVGQEVLTRLTGLPGGRRRATGSHEVSSHDPAGLPTVIWLNDRRPAVVDEATWPLIIGGAAVSISSLRAQARPLVATLDCTGGWWSEQSWDAVSLSELLPDIRSRSVRVVSQTGYDRFFATDVLDQVHLAVGYGGEPLRRGHGAPARLVVPGRRGPWWVKWVVAIEPHDRPALLQPPLPLT
jgi:Oxidoreductase molybdopterin binding domain